jgi:AraC family transcriptional regulator
MMITHALLKRDIFSRRLPPAATRGGDSCEVVESPHSCADIGGHARIRAEVTRLLDDVRSTLARNPERARVAAARLVTVLEQTAETEPARARSGLPPWQQRKVERFMRDHLESAIHLRDLAREVSLSKGHFGRAFKESFGDTPHAYIMRLRIRRAQELMLTTREPLSHIALICGFADQSHLTKVFRRMVGDVPIAWRRQNVSDGQAGLTNAFQA